MLKPQLNNMLKGDLIKFMPLGLLVGWLVGCV